MPAATIRDFADNAADPKVRGYLHEPQSPNGNGLVLTHGAGSNSQAPLLIALAETFSANGFTVLRCDLPYRQERRTGPPFPGNAERDRAGLRNAVAAIRKSSVEGRIFLGGHSYGGRQSTMLCAAEPDLVSGLVLLSYPLHPPRKPDQLRTQHFFHLHTPALFVEGTRDPFGTIAEIEQALNLIPAKTKLLTIEGAGHDLGLKGKAGREKLSGNVLSEFQEFFAK